MPETSTAPSPRALSPEPAGVSGGRSAFAAVKERVLHFGMVGVLVVVVIGAQIVYPGFLAPANIGYILSQNAALGIIAVGMTMVMVAGGFDLSVGAIYAASAVFYADMANRLSLGVAFALALVLGLAMGLINGLLVTKLKINAFVATLGTASVFGGAAYLYSHSTPITASDPGFQTLGLGTTLGLANATWLLVVVFVIGALVLSKSVFGRSLYAIGGNTEAAKLAGMRVDRIRAATYVIVGLCSAAGGAIMASRLGVGQADLGASVALDAIAVVVIGGTSLFGGEGAMWRTATGLLIVASITNLSDAIGLDSNSQGIIKGVIVISAVALDSYSRRRKG